jgi:hypothetical protein
MNMETVYSILMDSGWFFLTGWTLLLLVASAVVFSDESPKHALRLARWRNPVIYLPASGTVQKTPKVHGIASRH